MTRTILVTGAQGFIGRYLVRALCDRGDCRVIGAGRSPGNATRFTHHIHPGGAEHAAPLPNALVPDGPNYAYVATDLSHAAAAARLIAETAPDIVFHLAGSLRDEPFDRLVTNNIVVTRHLCDALAGRGAVLVLGSSGSIYGELGGGGLPLVETGATEPIDLYAATKRTSEDIVRIATRAGRIDGRVARIFNVVGPGQEERHVAGRIASQLTELRVGRRDGIALGPLTAWRDFIDVRDVASALVAIGFAGAGDIFYNVASGCETQIATVYDLLVTAAGIADPALAQLPGRAVDIGRQVVDVSRLRALGWQPRVDLPQSLGDVMHYYLELETKA
ncbi:NAD(P)-dependent oxidoreductase [Mesorhizobium mediterraneum]|uniref:NAD-dependent dehydratase n=1 Tax=Mesorhizobium mediterraneum TaxID=43617 RepID=A0AB36RE09_9HYPH|nr:MULTISPECIES: NAD(P)-dependent oxidoreductase [Mesorhizobium]RWN40705.1 MAG: NAD(P)-dependent oxidoreductase [Mesorhizobium sp.]PAQ02674.1 NAD-dependent dehydratase [Mesorhizobium mediterraneum]RUU46522.1 NAD(P)-dependent oxidoreductase [Mesorhizobium sp. M6A.T.Ce.TU.002.03.1.1]RWQ42409.1 MAG: NAD(P)-dependent oxidoreductase [Mesorhizobium sp.]WIW55855.1 NAD(P)-dependent oxidoreductase [Mesorhizobium mediterraneum]